MRYLALAADYDGTTARDDQLSDSAAQAIERLRVSGRRSILVTGRRLEDLLRVCPRVGIFDLVVAENGGGAGVRRAIGGRADCGFASGPVKRSRYPSEQAIVVAAVAVFESVVVLRKL